MFGVIINNLPFLQRGESKSRNRIHCNLAGTLPISPFFAAGDASDVLQHVRMGRGAVLFGESIVPLTDTNYI